jgi:hypothetical protein
MVCCFVTDTKSYIYYEKFEDTKGVIRVRISRKKRQHNGQKKKYKRIKNDLQSIHIKLKIFTQNKNPVNKIAQCDGVNIWRQIDISI